MTTTPSNRLAARLASSEEHVCRNVSDQMLKTYPELQHSLHLDGNATPSLRMSRMSAEPLNAMVRGILVFDTLSVAENELRWAAGVLPRYGVQRKHHTALMHTYFTEVMQLDLDLSEMALVTDLRANLLAMLDVCYQ